MVIYMRNYMKYCVGCEHKICFWASLNQTNRFGAWRRRKNLKGCERWLPAYPPPLGMSMLTDSMVFFAPFPKFYWQRIFGDSPTKSRKFIINYLLIQLITAVFTEQPLALPGLLIIIRNK